MPDLTNTVRWLDFEPDLFGNRDEARPFYLRINGSMSKEQLRALNDAVSVRSTVPEPGADATPEQIAEAEEATRIEVVGRYARALEPFVKLGDEPLMVDGKRIATLAEYLDLVSSKLVGLDRFFEPFNALTAANRMDGRTSFSSGRLSGGFTSTAPRRSGKAGQTVAR